MTEINILLIEFLAVFFFFESVPDTEPPSAAAKFRSSSNTGASAPKNISINVFNDKEAKIEELLSVLASSLKAFLIHPLI